MLTQLDNGSYIDDMDPGEPTTDRPRISVTDTEAKLLAAFARAGNVLEIGTGLGVSTRAMAAHAKQVITLDPDKWVWDHVWPTLPDNVTGMWHRGIFRVSFDMAFIDGVHQTDDVLADLEYVKTVMPHGLIVCHDAKIEEVRVALDQTGDWTYIDTTHGLALQWC